MGRSAFISAALHAAILLWIIAILPGARPLNAPPIREIPVDLLTPSQFTKIKAGEQNEKSKKALAKTPKVKAPSEEKAKPKATKTAAVLPRAQKPQPKPEPEKTPEKTAKAKPAPKPEDKADVPKPAPEKTAETQPNPGLPLKRPTPKRRPVKKADSKPKPKRRHLAVRKNDINTDRIAALLNKVPDSGGRPAADADSKDTEARVHGQSNGTKLAMSVDEIDALRAKIAQCWNPPPGGLGAAHIVVKLRMKLNEDGTLVGYPTVENSDPSPFFQAAADSAVRAVYQCQPYVLPRAKYSLWHDMILNFDPSEMYRAG